MDIHDIRIMDVQPSQFYICEEKVARIMAWFNPADLSSFEPVPIKILNNHVTFTDGHTRAFVAHNAGLEQIPLVWDNDEIDLAAYLLCVSACKRRGITSIVDLTNRTLPQNEYQIKWIGWCEVLHEVLEMQRQ